MKIETLEVLWFIALGGQQLKNSYQSMLTRLIRIKSILISQERRL